MRKSWCIFIFITSSFIVQGKIDISAGTWILQARLKQEFLLYLGSNSEGKRKYSIDKRKCFSKINDVTEEGLCMFHHECNNLVEGKIIGSCVDGFLFGVCCNAERSNANNSGLSPPNNSADHVKVVEAIVAAFNKTSSNSTRHEFLPPKSYLVKSTSAEEPPESEEEDDEEVIEVNAEAIEVMMNSILENVLTEFDSNVEPLLNLLFIEQETTTTTTTTTTKTTKKPVKTTTRRATTTTATTTKATTSHKPFDYRNDCGVRPIRGNGRIVGGTESSFGDWPWQVLVKESTWLGLFTKNKCGGVLISNKHVLTAAHCQPGFLASLLVELGEYDLTGPTEHMATLRRKVKRVVIHKDYKAPTFENDIAILELETDIERKPHVVPICMPKLSDEFVGKTGIVTGWGRLKYGGDVPNILHQVSVPIMNNTKCQQMFTRSGHKKTVRDSFLCAGYDEGKKDSCEVSKQFIENAEDTGLKISS